MLELLCESVGLESHCADCGPAPDRKYVSPWLKHSRQPRRLPAPVSPIWFLHKRISARPLSHQISTKWPLPVGSLTNLQALLPLSLEVPSFSWDQIPLWQEVAAQVSCKHHFQWSQASGFHNMSSSGFGWPVASEQKQSYLPSITGKAQQFGWIPSLESLYSWNGPAQEMLTSSGASTKIFSSELLVFRSLGWKWLLPCFSH